MFKCYNKNDILLNVYFRNESEKQEILHLKQEINEPRKEKNDLIIQVEEMEKERINMEAKLKKCLTPGQLKRVLNPTMVWR